MNFEQSVALVSLLIALATIIVNAVASYFSVKSAKTRLLTEKRIECYCNLIETLISINANGMTTINFKNYVKYTSSARLLAEKKHIDILSSSFEKIEENNFDMKDIGDLLKVLRNIINNN